MLLVHVYGHQHNCKLASILMPLSPLNVRLDALEEHIMASFILSPSTRNTIAVGFLDPYRLPSVSNLIVPVHSNLSQSIAYEIFKLRLLWWWAYHNLTHISDWEGIDLTSFKQERDTTSFRMAHFVTKFMSSTLPTIKILHQLGRATPNFFLLCSLAL